MKERFYMILNIEEKNNFPAFNHTALDFHDQICFLP